jgi:hypothetical protein
VSATFVSETWKPCFQVSHQLPVISSSIAFTVASYFVEWQMLKAKKNAKMFSSVLISDDNLIDTIGRWMVNDKSK